VPSSPEWSGKYLLREGLVGKLHEELGHLALLEDEDLDNGAEAGKALVDQLVAYL
jgi:hypothetical protein